MSILAQQADKLFTGMDAENMDAPSLLYRIIYAMRFEILFASGLLILWTLGRCFLPKKLDESKASRKNRSLPGVLPERPTKGAQQRSSGGNAATTQHLRNIRPRTGGELKETPDNTVGGDSHVGPFSQKEILPLTLAMPQPSQLRDPSWVIPRLIQLTHSHAQRAVVIYHAALDANLDLSEVNEADRDNLLVALMTSMIRMGLLDEATKILKDLQQRRIYPSSGLVTSTVKLCTAKHCFQECLSIYDLMTKMANGHAAPPAEKSVQSCLLFCAVESGAFIRCPSIFEELKKLGVPSQKDYWNMIRYGSHNGNWAIMLQLIKEMREHSMGVDSVIYNTALATCVSSDKMDQARVLLDEMDEVDGVTDVITYNTLMKGYSKSGNLDGCFKLYELMRERGHTPSQVTYGILLDGCISDNQVDRAAKVFDTMTEEGCPMNTVLYTTLIKGFAREQKVDEAMRIYGYMRSDKSVPPDLITFSILLKVNCDAGRLEEALKLLDDMLQIGLQPDEVIFNNLLSGCAKKTNAELAKRLYNDMISSGVKPSNATFSILIRLYSQCKLLDEAVEMLKTEPAEHKVELEPRLFSQLIQCCVRARQGRRAIEVHELMFQHSMPSVGVYSSTLGMCVKLNMFDTAVELLQAAAQRGARVDAADARSVLEGACRKKKTACADACVAAMQALGIGLEPPERAW